MFKLFEWVGSIIAIACLVEIASNPKQVMRDIQSGPAPHLARFDASLTHPNRPKKKTVVHKPVS